MFEESYHLRGWSKDVLNLFIVVFQPLQFKDYFYDWPARYAIVGFGTY